MKKTKIISLTTGVVWMLSMLLFSACSSNDDGTSINTNSPVIESVMRSGYDLNGNILPTTPVTQGDPKNYYIIHGSGLLSTKNVYFNDYDTYFGPTFVTDTDIIILIDENTPYADTSNEIKIVTDYGTTTYDFIVAPPVPTINWFNSINATEGDIVTVSGKYFLEPIVKVGTQEATIISSTLNELKFEMPSNSIHEYVSVSNISGSTLSALTIGSALYDDIIHQDAGHWTWDGSDFITNNDDAAQGNASIKIVFPGWGGADMKFNTIDVSKYKAFRVKVKSISENPDAKLTFVFGGWAFQIQKSLTSKWTTIEIPFSNIGNPTTFDQLTLQESGGFDGNTILMDEMGFVLK